MSSGLHLNKDIHDLIRSIGESRSKQEEDQIIAKDIEKLKVELGNHKQMNNAKLMRECLIRCIYADMLGHSVDFCHIFAVTMCQNSNLTVKRAAYLTCFLILSEESEFRMMIVATLQKDLLSTSTYNVLIALNTLCKLISMDNFPSFAEIIPRLLGNSSPLVRKKAFCVFGRMLKIAPQNIPNYELKLKDGLGDKDPSVLGVVLNIYHNESRKDPAKYKEILKILVAHHNKILDAKLPRDYDFTRIPAPWMQTKILQLYGILCKGDKALSEEVYNVIEKALRRSDNTLVAMGFAITYQCVQTLTQIYPNNSLLEKGSKVMNSFFKIENDPKINSSNLKYLAIESIRSLVKINPSYANQHQLDIVACLDHQDESLRIHTLDLLYQTTNSDNLEVVMKRMISFLRSTNDQRLRQDLVVKIYELNERLAKDPEWFINTVNQLLEFGSDCVSDEMLTRTIKQIDEQLQNDYDADFCQTLLNSYYTYLSRPLPDQLVKLIAWILGEISFRFYNDDSTSLNQLTEAITSLFDQQVANEQSKVMVINALSKLASCSGYEHSQQVEDCISKCLLSRNNELKQRAFEYRKNPSGIISLNKIQDFDYELSFLSSQVEAAVKKGQGYDRSKANTLLKKMKEKEKETSAHQFRTEHHKVDIADLKSKKEEFGTGFKDAKKNWMKQPVDLNDVKKPETQKPVEEVKKFDVPKKQTLDLATQKKQQQVANKLFGGQKEKPELTKSTKTTTFSKPAGVTEAQAVNKKANPFAKPKITPVVSSNPTKSNTMEKPQLVEEQDLLDDTPSIKLEKQEIDLLSGTGAPQLAGKKPSPFSKPSNVPVKTSAPSKPAFSLTPLKLEQSEFEAEWVNLEDELFDDDIPTKKVKNQKAFQQMVDTIGFHIVQKINNDNICVAQLNQNSTVLLYGQHKIVGGLEIRVKSTSSEICQKVIDLVRDYCKNNQNQFKSRLTKNLPFILAQVQGNLTNGANLSQDLLIINSSEKSKMRINILADALNAIVNAERKGLRQVLLRPASKVLIKFLKQMQKHGYIGEFELIDDHRSNKIVVELLGRVNKCGVISPRFDINLENIERWITQILPSKQFGHLIVSTTYGIMDHNDCKARHTGGKVIGFFY